MFFAAEDIRAARSAIMEREVENAFLPVEAIVPLLQHEGKPARRVVEIGERVIEGQLVGRQDGPDSANAHAPIPGTVTSVSWGYNENSIPCESLVIALSGKFDRLGKRPQYFPWKNLPIAEIIRIIGEMGVVTMDRSGVPVASLLNDLRGSKKTAFIVNAVESEPFVHNNAVLLDLHAEAIAEGCEILAKVLAVKTFVLMHEDDVMGGASSVRSFLEGKDCEMKSVRASNPYPSDSPDDMRKIAAQAWKGRPQKERCDVSSAPIFDLETVFAIAEAVTLNKPLYERYLSVSGSAIKHSGILKVRIGMKIGDVIAECGGLVGVPRRLLLGGTLRGLAVSNMDMPITKTTKALLGLSESDVHSLGKTPCIGCRKCVDACPVSLDPSRLGKLLERGLYERATAEGLRECTLCGACSIVCPSRIPLRQALSVSKNAHARGK